MFQSCFQWLKRKFVGSVFVFVVFEMFLGNFLNGKIIFRLQRNFDDFGLFYDESCYFYIFDFQQVVYDFFCIVFLNVKVFVILFCEVKNIGIVFFQYFYMVVQVMFEQVQVFFFYVVIDEVLQFVIVYVQFYQFFNDVVKFS